MSIAQPEAVPADSATRSSGGWLRLLSELTRARITVAVTFTTATGYLLGAGHADVNLWVSLLGVFLLASGSSALNQCQETGIDARMERTRRRPIPSGRIDVLTALFVATLLLLSGLGVLASVGKNTNLLLLLGGFAVLWYNGVYTYLKRLTAFAVVPGALIGAIPPVMGYVAAGGQITDPLVFLVGMFFFIWQIPHFWLLLLMCGRQYGDAGLPTLTNVFTEKQLLRITFMWVMATAAAGLVFPTVASRDVALPWSVAIVLASVWLAEKAVSTLMSSRVEAQKSPFRLAFMHVNIYALMVMLALSLSALQTPAG